MITNWKRSTFCEAGSCIEVEDRSDAVMVRDSKLGSDSPVLSFEPAAWTEFVDGLKDGRS
jgi:hypothetical protein